MNSALRLDCSAFQRHKGGARPSDWEDGAYLSEARGRVAVADGASAAFGAQQWSRLLVEGWCTWSGPAPIHDVCGWVTEMRDRWQTHLARDSSAELPMYLQTHRRNTGAVSHATFVGLDFTPSKTPDQLDYSGVGIGDSVMVHVRGGRTVATFPSSLSDFEFTDSPPLLSTRSDAAASQILTFEGSALDGDVFLLMTDALAEYIRDRAATDARVWPALSTIGSRDFQEVVDVLRAGDKMTNDDVTLVRACVVPRNDQVGS